MKVSLRQQSARRGASAVEFAIIAPIFFSVVFGLIEFSRMVMCYQVMTNAAREAAREGTLAGISTSDVIDRANTVLQAGAVSGATASVQPAQVAVLEQGESFTVTVQGPYNAMGWLPVPQWLGGRMIGSSVTMKREGS